MTESKPVSAHDVARYILARRGNMTAMKLQKLLYYSQAWSLVWDEAPLFKEPIEAWANGPVVRDVYDVHKGSFSVGSWPLGDESRLSDDQRETIDSVLKFYGDRSAQYLSDLTHEEDPWKTARGPLPPGAPSSALISHASMAEYYGSL